MKIIQISDLHIDASFNTDLHTDMIDEMCKTINNTPLDDEVLFVTCGDIVNKGDKNGFHIARAFFQRIQAKLNRSKIDYLFVPGNHDLCSGSFDSFDEFSSLFITSCQFKDKNVLLYEYSSVQIFGALTQSVHLA